MEGYEVIRGTPQPMPLEQAVRRVREISSLPQVSTRIMEVVRDANTSAAMLTGVVETDPALCARLLRCVNSAAYGLRYKITTVARAVAYVGFKAVRNLALTSSICEMFKRDTQVGPYCRLGLWRHMVAVAVASRLFARRAGAADFEEAFLAGLLHDVGLIVEDQYLHRHFVYLIERLGQRPLTEVELEVLGFDHTFLGECVAENWKFPPEAMAAIRYHHSFPSYNGPHQTLVAAVVTANLVCALKGYPALGAGRPVPCAQALAALNMNVQDLQVLAADLDGELNQHQALFQMVEGNGI